MNSYTFKVKMSCYGCVGAVIKALTDAGIKGVDVNFEDQLVYVKSDKTGDDISKLILATGKIPVLVN
jgi:copper chaperone CopZ